MSDWYVKDIVSPQAWTRLIRAATPADAVRSLVCEFSADRLSASQGTEIHVRKINIGSMKTCGPIYRYRIVDWEPRQLGVLEARRVTPKWWDYSFVVENKEGYIVRHVRGAVAAYSGRPAPAKAVRDFAAKLDPMHATSDRIYVAYEKVK